MMASPRVKILSGRKMLLRSDVRGRSTLGGPTSKDEILSFSNICGLNSNIDSVHHHLQTCNPCILFLTETQVSPKSSTNHLLFPNYELLPRFRLHGGVCAYVRNDISCTRLPLLEHDNPDTLWLKISSNSSVKFVCCLYRSPNDSTYKQLFESLSSKIEKLISDSPSAEIIILGDFNVHHKDWLNSSKTDPPGREAENFAISNSLTNLVNEPTYFPRVSSHAKNPLDLFLTTHPDPYKASVSAPLGRSDHGLISLSFPLIHNSTETAPPRNLWHYKRADWEGLRDFFSSYPWGPICFTSSDPSEICAQITEVIKLGMEMYIPHSVKAQHPRKNKPWFSKECDSARRKKSQAHKKSLSNPTPENRQMFTEARNHYNSVIQKSKNSFNNQLRDKVLSCPNGSKSFWSLAKSISQNLSTSGFPPLVVNDEIISTSKEKAELFAKQFSANSTLSPPDNISVPTIPDVLSKMPQISFIAKDVRKVLSHLNTQKSPGLDDIPAIVLKNCSPELAPVLTRLFQLSYDQGIFPNSWKVARVQPVPKKGSKNLPSNYRPISLLPIISKVMESIINSKLLKYLEKHKLIHDRQYGFRRRRSTADLLTSVTHSWNKSIELHGESFVICLDISKAFDQVWHAALLNKLPSYGLPLKLCAWIESFLANRQICVVVNGHSSNQYPINAGVPQGSVLAPTLFLIYINDLLSSASNCIHSYADDSTLHASIEFANKPNKDEFTGKQSSVQMSLNQDLKSIQEWGARNLVQFNASKTQFCTLSQKKSDIPATIIMDGISLQNSASFEVVGVSFDRELNWHKHVTSIATSAAKKLGFLFRARKYFSPLNLYTLYVSQVRPNLEYCSHIWGAASPTTLKILDSIQKKAFRLINDPHLTSKLPPLSHRRAVGDLCLFYRYFHGFCSEELSSLIPPLKTSERPTRSSSHMHPFTVQLETPRTEHFKRSFIPRVSTMWNSLPAHVFPSPPNPQSFKSRINQLPHSFFEASTVR